MNKELKDIESGYIDTDKSLMVLDEINIQKKLTSPHVPIDESNNVATNKSVKDYVDSKHVADPDYKDYAKLNEDNDFTKLNTFYGETKLNGYTTYNGLELVTKSTIPGNLWLLSSEFDKKYNYLADNDRILVIGSTETDKSKSNGIKFSYDGKTYYQTNIKDGIINGLLWYGNDSGWNYFKALVTDTSAGVDGLYLSDDGVNFKYYNISSNLKNYSRHWNINNCYYFIWDDINKELWNVPNVSGNKFTYWPTTLIPNKIATIKTSDYICIGTNTENNNINDGIFYQRYMYEGNKWESTNIVGHPISELQYFEEIGLFLAVTEDTHELYSSADPQKGFDLITNNFDCDKIIFGNGILIARIKHDDINIYKYSINATDWIEIPDLHSNEVYFDTGVFYGIGNTQPNSWKVSLDGKLWSDSNTTSIPHFNSYSFAKLNNVVITSDINGLGVAFSELQVGKILESQLDELLKNSKFINKFVNEILIDEIISLYKQCNLLSSVNDIPKHILDLLLLFNNFKYLQHNILNYNNYTSTYQFKKMKDNDKKIITDFIDKCLNTMNTLSDKTLLPSNINIKSLIK